MSVSKSFAMFVLNASEYMTPPVTPEDMSALNER